jgi:HPt (histidine-containing phosphotransfer) domain-containing protein
MSDPNATLTQLAQEARQLQSKLAALWADEGVDQLHIFLDPEITDVLDEIKQLSMDFVTKVAQSSD